ncbi:MAG: AGE family epimerase/isomerase [Ruminococcus callidus]
MYSQQPDPLVFSSGNAAETSDLRQAADHAYRFLMRYCMDRKAGGVYWSVTLMENRCTTKHTYNQAFAIYALSAYYRLTGNPKALFAANQSCFSAWKTIAAMQAAMEKPMTVSGIRNLTKSFPKTVLWQSVP